VTRMLIVVLAMACTIPVSASRFENRGGVIRDTETNLKWVVGPDVNTSFNEAQDWIESLGEDWRLPTLDELHSLYDAGIRRSAISDEYNSWGLFENNGWMVWSDRLLDSSTAYGFAFATGNEVSFPKDYSLDCRAFAVLSEGEATLSESSEASSSSDAQSISSNLLCSSNVWYASELRKIFPSSIVIHGYEYRLDDIYCLPEDILEFHIVEAGLEHALGLQYLGISGTISVSAIQGLFNVVNGATSGESYMIKLQAYLISPEDELVWTQDGYPRGGSSWINLEGGTREFSLVSGYSGSVDEHELLVIAIAENIQVAGDLATVILGAKIIRPLSG